jgi:poly(A) polymerase
LEHTLIALESLETLFTDPETVFPERGNEIHRFLHAGKNAPLLKLAILLHDLGKALTRTEERPHDVHFIGHEKISESLALDIAGRFRLSQDETAVLSLVIREHLRLIHLFEADKRGELTTKGIFRFGRSAGDLLWGLALHTWADSAAARGPASKARGGLAALTEFLNRVVREVYSQRATLQSAGRLIDGHELMHALSIPPSPLVGRLLAAIEEALATGAINGRDQALALARELLSGEDV